MGSYKKHRYRGGMEKRPRYNGKYFYSRGVSIPLDAASTEDLIEEINRLRKKSGKKRNELWRMNYYGWIVEWRNRNPDSLPKELKYKPSKWNLEEITEYNYPENIYELSVLYFLALRRSKLGKINLLHDILYQKGWVYRPPKFTDFRDKEDGVYESGYLEPATMDYSKEDMEILRSRGLLKDK